MANETNQNGDNVEQSGMPTRILRIDGERTGRLFTNAIRVGRIDKRLRELSLSTNADSRRQFRLGDEGFSKAIGDFENALDQIEKDLAFTRRSSKTTPQGNRQQAQSPQSDQRTEPKKTTTQRVVAGLIQLIQPKEQPIPPGAAATPVAKPALSGNQQSQQPQAQTKPKKRKKRKKPTTANPQGQVAVVGGQKPDGAKQPDAKGGTVQQAPTKAGAAGKAGQSKAPGSTQSEGQQQRPAAEKTPAVTPALL
ncbi:hypothetical protein [Pseudomonas sp. NPDC089569]|uniref:hypothetical protein n=1 Tax=Pseudomonas sp. NPDC089569 TaxID=3390722 RepID=UPI003D071112